MNQPQKENRKFSEFAKSSLTSSTPLISYNKLVLKPTTRDTAHENPRPPNDESFTNLRPSHATMQSVDESPFMALPTELRCYIYDYLPKRVYNHVFPTPGICTWAVFRMPTALLQLNKTIFDEANEALRIMNNQLSPRVTIGPAPTGRDALFALMSDIFHEAAKRRYTSACQSQNDDDGTRLISPVLASWYNETIVSPAIQSECAAEDLHPFVDHTLSRMKLKSTCEIRIRFLVFSHRDDNFTRGPGEEDYLYCEMMIACDKTRRALSVESGRSLTIVPFKRHFRPFLKRDIESIRKLFWNVKVGKLSARDRALFDATRLRTR